MAGKPTTIDEYLAALSDDKRVALERLRKVIRAAAPRAEECISYRLPAFRLNGRMLVAFGATANHCAFYPMSSTTAAAHKDELKDYDTSKGTIRFQPDKPLPAALVRKLVKLALKRMTFDAKAASCLSGAAPKPPAFSALGQSFVAFPPVGPYNTTVDSQAIVPCETETRR